MPSPYIALFSNFISCGVWEGVHILDGLLENKSEIQPDTLHGDTQGQSEAIFGLALLLGIKLMPRIRNWSDLRFYLPQKECRTDHLKSLFIDTIDWDLIARHMPELIRYNQLVAHLIVLHNTVHLTNTLNQFALQGETLEPEVLAALSPYKSSHINRFGKYEIGDRDKSINLKNLDLSFNIKDLNSIC